MCRENPLASETAGSDALLVAGAFFLQVAVLRIENIGAVTGVAAGAAFLAVTVGRTSPGRLLRSLTGLIVMLLAVLAARLVTEFSLSTVYHWGFYAARILAAVLIALTLLGRIGPGGVHRGIRRLLSPLPAVVTRPVLDMIATTMYLLPAVRRQLTGSVAVARVRLSRTGTGTLRRTVMISRAGLISLVALPRQRAEAMLVRGLLDSGRHDNNDNTFGSGGVH